MHAKEISELKDCLDNTQQLIEKQQRTLELHTQQMKEMRKMIEEMS